MKRKLFYVALAVFGVLIVSVIGVSAVWPVINDVETGKTPEYADLLPQYYSTDPQRVFEEARGGVTAMKR